MKPVREMPLGERGREIERLRRAITRWARIYKKGGNERCHEEDERLARVVGQSLYPSSRQGELSIMTACQFRANCVLYIARECKAGRLIDDRLPTA